MYKIRTKKGTFKIFELQDDIPLEGGYFKLSEITEEQASKIVDSKNGEFKDYDTHPHDLSYSYYKNAIGSLNSLLKRHSVEIKHNTIISMY